MQASISAMALLADFNNDLLATVCWLISLPDIAAINKIQYWYKEEIPAIFSPSFIHSVIGTLLRFPYYRNEDYSHIYFVYGMDGSIRHI